MDLPPHGWIKLNSDGFVDANLKALCGGVLRGSSGEFLGGFVVNLGSVQFQLRNYEVHIMFFSQLGTRALGKFY